MFASGVLFGGAAALTTSQVAALGAVAVGSTLIATQTPELISDINQRPRDITATELGDTIVQATDAGKNDPHGDSGRALEQAEAQIAELEAQLAELVRTQGPKKEKSALKKKIEQIRKDAERAKKGETHGRRGKGNH